MHDVIFIKAKSITLSC